MKMQINIRHLTFTLSFLLVISGPLSIQAVPETNEVNGVNTAPEQSFLDLSFRNSDPLTVFSYQIKGRPDPFSPFITEKSTSTLKMDEIVESEETLSGMQLFEPGQLKLVAIVFEKNAELAMVEDSAGQGYALRPGMKIGRKGIITAITANQVIIEETSITRAGQKLTNNIVMLLKKKGEE
ncbi:MAG: pilus assembly protein PilP [Desulfoarculaceae bacterium]|nr:pilus assembly protein PilP [Desulfoarculaceae bacterium]